MTAQEFELAIRNALSSPADAPWLGYMAIIVLAFAGGYLGSFIKKRGELVATRKEFDTLLAQTRKTTEDTEKIKQELAGLNWLRQQQWQSRLKHYETLLENLFKLKITLEERAGYFREPGSERRDDHIRTRHFEDQTHLGSEAFEKVQRLTGSAAIGISDKATEALVNLGREHRDIMDRSVNLAEYLVAFQAAVSATYDCVLAEARSQLREAAPETALS